MVMFAASLARVDLTKLSMDKRRVSRSVLTKLEMQKLPTYNYSAYRRR